MSCDYSGRVDIWSALAPAADIRAMRRCEKVHIGAKRAEMRTISSYARRCGEEAKQPRCDFMHTLASLCSDAMFSRIQ